jgi:SIR2-like domain
MNDDDRVYFIGAGGSKQDRFPLTNELKHGIAWAILQDPSRFELLAAHLQYLYNVQDVALEESAQIWAGLRQRANDRPQTDCSQMPDVTDLLSTLDWMIREQSSFGPSLHTGDSAERSSAGELARVRDLVVQALCYCLGTYDDLNAASTTRDFIQLVRPDDSLVTTNWDLLLDAARDRRFGSEPQDYGTTGNVALEGGTEPQADKRPKLLKLHGSLSWRYCQRCQRLVIDPLHHVAGERQERATCLCTCRFSELIVTPGFVREYRNVHLLTIWREALLTLARASRWIFVGYSLPADDVGIRTLLLKARCVRHDVGGEAPLVTIVTGPDRREETLARYRGILPQAELDPDDFGHFVQRAGTDTL